jgi:hypothetical protein
MEGIIDCGVGEFDRSSLNGLFERTSAKSGKESKMIYDRHAMDRLEKSDVGKENVYLMILEIDVSREFGS